MFIVVWAVKVEVNFVAAIFAGAIVYGVLAYLLKLFSFEAIRNFYNSLKVGKVVDLAEGDETG